MLLQTTDSPMKPEQDHTDRQPLPRDAAPAPVPVGLKRTAPLMEPAAQPPVQTPGTTRTPGPRLQWGLVYSSLVLFVALAGCTLFIAVALQAALWDWVLINLGVALLLAAVNLLAHLDLLLFRKAPRRSENAPQE